MMVRDKNMRAYPCFTCAFEIKKSKKNYRTYIAYKKLFLFSYLFFYIHLLNKICENQLRGDRSFKKFNEKYTFTILFYIFFNYFKMKVPKKFAHKFRVN